MTERKRERAFDPDEVLGPDYDSGCCDSTPYSPFAEIAAAIKWAIDNGYKVDFTRGMTLTQEEPPSGE